MSTESQSNGKRIAKNTGVLYFRMLFLMLISLYTSRVILQALGVEDYGIYNVVGGFVALFSVISRSLSSASSRFLNFEMGKGDYNRLKKVFSTSVTIQIILIVIIFCLCESVGLWFLEEKMTIPANRMMAARWTYQFSVITFCSNLYTVPYNAAIIAHERMKAFAYVSILEGISKLIIAFLVMISPIDTLVFYSLLMCVLQISIQCIYRLYCQKQFEECKYAFAFDCDLIKEMFGYAGWNFIGATASVLQTHGGNVILNLFYGPVVNAARGVANQVLHSVHGFVTNFMVAMNPQITQSYAKGDYNYMFNLVFKGSKLSYFMLLLISLPVMFCSDYILHIWLVTVPDHSRYFVILTLILSLIESISQPLITMQQATGKVKNYQLLVGGIMLLNLPLSYVACTLGFPPENVLLVAIICAISCLIGRLYMLRINVQLDIMSFVRNVIYRIIIVTVISSIAPFIMLYFNKVDCFMSAVVMVLISMLSVLTTVYFIGLLPDERTIVVNFICKIYNKIK